MSSGAASATRHISRFCSRLATNGDATVCEVSSSAVRRTSIDSTKPEPAAWVTYLKSTTIEGGRGAIGGATRNFFFCFFFGFDLTITAAVHCRR